MIITLLRSDNALEISDICHRLVGKDQGLIIYGYIFKYGLLFLSYTYF